MAAIDYPDLTLGDPELESVLAEIREGRPFVPNLYRMLLWSPAVTAGWVKLANSVRFEAELDDRLRELTILLISHRTDCEYEWYHHVPLALGAGATENEVKALRSWPDGGSWSSGDRAVLGFVAGMLDREGGAGGMVDELREHLGEKGVVELGALVAYYLGLSHFLIAMDVEIENHEHDGGGG